MTHSPEIAAMLHRNRFKRFLNLTRDVPRVKDCCAWCGGHSNYGLKYCSMECHDDAYIRYSGSVVADAVLRRDHGVCAVCGMDCVWLAAASLSVRSSSVQAAYLGRTKEKTAALSTTFLIGATECLPGNTGNGGRFTRPLVIRLLVDTGNGRCKDAQHEGNEGR